MTTILPPFFTLTCMPHSVTDTVSMHFIFFFYWPLLIHNDIILRISLSDEETNHN